MSFNVDPYYSKLLFSEQRELDQKAYSKYYQNCCLDNALSFNNWYGTKYHIKYVKLYLRKYKLREIEKSKLQP